MRGRFWRRTALRALAVSAVGVAMAIPLGAGVAGAATMALTPTSLATATVGSFYSATITAINGSGAPYTEVISSGSLCPGLNFSFTSPNGTISGTPTTSGAYPFQITATDSVHDVITDSYVIDCNAPPLTITTGGLPAATQGVGYGATVVATGGVPPYTWTASGLPTGLSINALNGSITGTPTVPGNFCPAITVLDSESPAASATKTLCIDVTSGVQITSTSPLPTAPVNVHYTDVLTAAGGTAPYKWSQTGGLLPPGVGLAANGTLSGTPTVPGTYTFTATVTDSTLPTHETASASLVLVVAPSGLTLTSSPPDGVLGVGYSFIFTAAGGTAPYSYSVSNGSLPPGLFLNPNTGQVSGTPTTTGFYPFTIEANDSSSPSKSAFDSTGITVEPQLVQTTGALPDGTVGALYSQMLTAAGGLPPYHWAVSSGALPGGLSLNAASGQISGTPTVAGTFTFGVTVHDSAAPPQVDTVVYQIKVDAGLVPHTLLPDGVVGSGYVHSVTVTGGTAPYFWSVSVGSLPPGLSLIPTTGQISGTPTTPGTYPFTLTVADSSTPQLVAISSTSITIESVISSSTTSLPDGVVGSGYSQAVSVSGGLAPYFWVISGGALPGGLTLSPTTGTIAGTPTTPGAFHFTVAIRDASIPPQVVFVPLTITIQSDLVLVGGALPGGSIGDPYSVALTPAGGLLPYHWFTVGGSLPPGLSFSTVTGDITGTPIASGFYSFTVGVSDSSTPAQTVEATFTIDVTQLLTITSSSPLPVAFVGTPYSDTLTAIGGSTPYHWVVSSGALPAGLALSGGGHITGTPLAPGTVTFTVTVSDSSTPTPQTAVGAFTLTVEPRPLTNSTAATLPNGSVGVPYSVGQSVTGGTLPYAFAISTGSLPAGLLLNPSTGVISGTPTTAGTSCFTVSVSDNSSPVQTVFDSECITITSGLTITTTFLPSATVGTGYLGTVQSTGGTAPVTFSLAGGALPPGLALNANGTITGTPSTPGTYLIVVQATDSSLPTHETASQLLQIVVSP